LGIQALRADHRVIVRLVAGVRGCAAGLKTRGDGLELVALLGRLDRRLIDHLAAEDEGLYPALAQSDDPALRRAAEEAIRDLGGLKEAWRAYLARWDLEAMLAAPEVFRATTAALMSAIVFRIELEEATLYPLAAELALEGAAA